jgi:uncharacterized nucleotidyltransferase DUF6036
VPEHALPDPWRSFLDALDALLEQPTEVHCIGGFVIAERYDFTRITADVDVIEVRGSDPAKLSSLAGKGSTLHQRHKVYIDIVTVASVPDNYESRLIDLLPNQFENLRLRAFEAHDLVLAKLARNIDRDREDVKRLAEHPGLDPAVLTQRYREELRYQLGRPEREDLTLALWLEMIEEVREKRNTDTAAPPPRKAPGL